MPCLLAEDCERNGCSWKRMSFLWRMESVGRVDVIVLPARKMFLLIEKSGTEACLFRDDFRRLLRVYGEIVRLRTFTYSS